MSVDDSGKEKQSLRSLVLLSSSSDITIHCLADASLLRPIIDLHHVSPTTESRLAHHIVTSLNRSWGVGSGEWN